jgi:hypothetical protein
MRAHTWRPVKPKPPPKPKVTADLREAIDAQGVDLIAALKKRLRKKPKKPQFNWCSDLLTRWHREALYVVAVMRTPHGRPPTFETHVARMEHAGAGKFNLAVPMRRGWNTVKRGSTPEECLQAISEFVCF